MRSTPGNPQQLTTSTLGLLRHNMGAHRMLHCIALLGAAAWKSSPRFLRFAESALFPQTGFLLSPSIPHLKLCAPSCLFRFLTSFPIYDGEAGIFLCDTVCVTLSVRMCFHVSTNVLCIKATVNVSLLTT